MQGLCTAKVAGFLCTLDEGHAGLHDTRSRAEIMADRRPAPRPYQEPVHPVCAPCAGTGAVRLKENQSVRCETCGGRGRVIPPDYAPPAPPATADAGDGATS